MLKRKTVESWRNVREPLGINGRQLSTAPSPLSPSGRWGGGGGWGWGEGVGEPNSCRPLYLQAIRPNDCPKTFSLGQFFVSIENLTCCLVQAVQHETLHRQTCLQSSSRQKRDDAICQVIVWSLLGSYLCPLTDSNDKHVDEYHTMLDSQRF